MITKLTHAPVLVLDQASAYDFYVNKLGFKIKLDLPMPEDGRWLTVYPPEQPDFEIILAPVARSFHTKETTEMLKNSLLTELLVVVYLLAKIFLLPTKN